VHCRRRKKRFLGKGNRFFCGVFDFHGKSKGLPGVGLSPFLKKKAATENSVAQSLLSFESVEKAAFFFSDGITVVYVVFWLVCKRVIKFLKKILLLI